MGENPAALRAAVFLLSSKNLRGAFINAPPPPSRARVNPRPVRAFLITRTVRGGGVGTTPPPGDRPLMVVELRGKDQSMRLDEISRLHILFLVLGQHLT